MYVKFETLFTWLQKLWINEICIELVSEFLELLSTPMHTKSAAMQCITVWVFRSWIFQDRDAMGQLLID